MSDLQEKRHGTYRVSSLGQFSFPASARRRWGIEAGGEVELFDLGDAVVMLPSGSAPTSVARALNAQVLREHLEAITDPNLRDE